MCFESFSRRSSIEDDDDDDTGGGGGFGTVSAAEIFCFLLVVVALALLVASLSSPSPSSLFGFVEDAGRGRASKRPILFFYRSLAPRSESVVETKSALAREKVLETIRETRRFATYYFALARVYIHTHRREREREKK